MAEQGPPRNRAFTVALTGGVASGKSAVTQRFAALGAAVIDADVIARELVEPGRAALAQIAAHFGNDVLDRHGRLDRAALRAHIFAEPSARARLEAILHPRVRDEIRRRAQAVTGTYALLAIPLFVESGHYAWVDRVVVVDLPRAGQRERLMARDHIAAPLAEAMLDAQATREQRLAVADDIIDNSGPLEALDAQVTRLDRRYRQLAGLPSAHAT